MRPGIVMLAAIVMATLSCGTSGNVPEKCEVKLAFSETLSDPNASARTLVRFSGDLSTTCKALVTQNKGDVTYALSLTTPAVSGWIYRLETAQRSYDFPEDDTSSLSQGNTYETSFRSDAVTAWQLPWRADETKVTLAFVYPAGTPSTQWPSAVSLSIKK